MALRPWEVRSNGNAKPLDPDGYAVTVHRFSKPGRYIVRVERFYSGPKYSYKTRARSLP